MNTIPLRLLFWTVCVLLICFLRVASLMVQSLPGFEGFVEKESLYSSIYVVGMLNLFEVIPILMFLRAIVLVGNYMKKGQEEQCLENSSISALMQAMVSDIVWEEY